MENTGNQDMAGDSGCCQPMAVTPDEIRDELTKVLTSQTFHAAQGQRIFLQYAVEETVAGRGPLLKEYVIATQALQRDESFDPRLDPIVRTQARKLRARLAKYYETEGERDSIRIEFPKGSYAPMFSRVEAPVPAVEDSPAESVVTLPVVPSPVAGKTSGRIAVASIAMALVLAAAAITVYKKSASLPGGQALASVAVLPFVDVSEDQDQTRPGAALSEQLLRSLRAEPGLQVTIRRDLPTSTVVLGAVRRLQNRLLVTIQLNSVPNGYHLWTGSFDRDASDLGPTNLDVIGGEISRSIADVLGGGPGERHNRELLATLARPSLPNASARESYERGLEGWRRLTPAGLQVAKQAFQEAIGRDPSYALAYSALANCYVMAPQFGSPFASLANAVETAGRIKELAGRALALDASLGEPHFALGVSAEYAFDWTSADLEFKRGLELSPRSPVGHLWYAKYLALVGRKTEVLAHRRRAATLDPVSAYAAQSVAGYFSVMGRYDAAISQFKTALALQPNFGLAHQGLGFTYLLAGRSAEALGELQLADRLLAGPYREALLGYAYAVSGETADAHRILNGLLEQAQRGAFPAVTIAHVYIGLGDKDHAFEWLQRAVDQRDLSLDLQWDPVYRSVRPDPRYAALLRRMKLG